MPPKRKTTIECPICMNEIDSNKNVMITECGHKFHSSCMIKHITIKNDDEPCCPMCRAQLTQHIKTFTLAQVLQAINESNVKSEYKADYIRVATEYFGEREQIEIEMERVAPDEYYPKGYKDCYRYDNDDDTYYWNVRLFLIRAKTPVNIAELTFYGLLFDVDLILVD